jgi:hypothetical protein
LLRLAQRTIPSIPIFRFDAGNYHLPVRKRYNKRLTCHRRQVAHQNNARRDGGAAHIEPEITMNTKLLLPVLTAMTLAAAGTSALAAAQASDFRGSAAPAQTPVDQVVVVTDATRHVNVTGGSTVRFVVGDRSFSWSFQNGSAHVTPFDLQLIAPKGLLNHPVTAYVSDNPLYQNN